MKINRLIECQKESSVKSNLKKYIFCNTNFKGCARYAEQRTIRSAEDAIKQWEILKHPMYTDIFQATERASAEKIIENKNIRNANYAFLDKLCDAYDKQKFIEYFTKLTGFPNLQKISTTILSEFKRVLGVAASNMGFKYDDIRSIGYDKYCSVGLEKALPGSDIDKGYAIIPTQYASSTPQKSISDKFKGEIWNNLDNRIMSVNHYAAFPNIMTEKEVKDNITRFDDVAKNIVRDGDAFTFYRGQRLFNPYLIPGAKFNIYLSQLLDNANDKMEAKNFAYIIETMRDGAKLKEKVGFLWADLNDSIFCHCTNVTQARIVQDAYDYGTSEKPKIIARQNLEQDFNAMDTNTKYDLIKDVIRSMSEDNKDVRFQKLFAAKTDKQNLLLTDILTGEVTCVFDYVPNYGERAHLFLSGENIKKYCNINVYEKRI